MRRGGERSSPIVPVTEHGSGPILPSRTSGEQTSLHRTQETYEGRRFHPPSFRGVAMFVFWETLADFSLSWNIRIPPLLPGEKGCALARVKSRPSGPMHHGFGRFARGHPFHQHGLNLPSEKGALKIIILSFVPPVGRERPQLSESTHQSVHKPYSLKVSRGCVKQLGVGRTGREKNWIQIHGLYREGYMAQDQALYLVRPQVFIGFPPKVTMDSQGEFFQTRQPGQRGKHRLPPLEFRLIKTEVVVVEIALFWMEKDVQGAHMGNVGRHIGRPIHHGVNQFEIQTRKRRVRGNVDKIHPLTRR